jgi:hypothetical protein
MLSAWMGTKMLSAGMLCNAGICDLVESMEVAEKEVGVRGAAEKEVVVRCGGTVG